MNPLFQRMQLRLRIAEDELHRFAHGRWDGNVPSMGHCSTPPVRLWALGWNLLADEPEALATVVKNKGGRGIKADEMSADVFAERLGKSKASISEAMKAAEVHKKTVRPGEQFSRSARLLRQTRNRPRP